MMKIKVLKGFESRCRGTKQAAGIASTKALEQKKQDMSTGMAKKSKLPIPSSGKGLLWRLGDSLEPFSPTWAPAPLAT